jgi:hypothetical protein
LYDEFAKTVEHYLLHDYGYKISKISSYPRGSDSTVREIVFKECSMLSTPLQNGDDEF